MLKLKFLAALLAAAPVPALAAERPVESAAVQYSDLNLTTKAGRAQLERRIRAHAKTVCRVNLDAGGCTWRCMSASPTQRPLLGLAPQMPSPGQHVRPSGTASRPHIEG